MGKKIDLEVNFFDVLGVKASSSDEEVKKAYKALAKQWHPDKNRDEGAEERFKVISAAYDTLKTADLRSIYRRERDNAQADAEREKRWKDREAECFSRARSRDGPNSRFKTSFFFNTDNDPFSGRSHKTYTSSGSDSFRYGSRDESPFSGPYQKKSKFKPRKPWSQEWNEPDDDGFKPFGFGFNSRPNFSSAFTSFVDDLFDFKTFFDGNDPFEGFFKKYEDIFKPFSEKKHQPNAEFTYYSHFDDGSSSSKFHGQEKENKTQNGKRKDMPGFSFDDYSDDEEEKLKFECVCCGKRFSVHEDMLRHELVCKEVNGKANGTTKFPKPPFVAKPTGDWRTTHENLVRNIRNLRRSSSRTRIEDEDSEEERLPESDYVKCHICGRTFNKPSMERHTIYCQMRYQANCGEPEEVFFSRELPLKSYPKTMPTNYSNSGIPPSGRSQSNHAGSDSPRMSRSTTPGKYSSKTCFPDLRTRRTMDEPFVFTPSGLHTNRSTSRINTGPRMYEFRFSTKGANNFGVSGSRTPFQDEGKHLKRNQCPNCCSVFAKNARYCISCGFKRPG